jgi:Domain of unknown function (DUF5658)
MCRNLFAFVLLGVFIVMPQAAVRAFAQGDPAPEVEAAPARIDFNLAAAIGPISFGGGAGAQQAQTEAESMKSRVLIRSLYVTTAVMQALDAHSTFKALDAGAAEANPLMRPWVENRGAFIALKVGMTAGIIYVGHSLYKRNKLAGVLALVAVNVGYGIIVAHNYDVARSQQAQTAR